MNYKTTAIIYGCLFALTAIIIGVGIGLTARDKLTGQDFLGFIIIGMIMIIFLVCFIYNLVHCCKEMRNPILPTYNTYNTFSGLWDETSNEAEELNMDDDKWYNSSGDES